MATNPINPALPADLPENWVYGDTVSPNGTETGLTPRHGYNYLMQQVNAAQEAANALGEAMEDVPQLEDGKIPASQLPIGTPGGAASLDESGKVPASQLPPMDYVPTSEKGAAGGVATLDSSGKLKEAQKPAYTAAEVGAIANPAGGTTGQVLTKTDGGAAWGDAPQTGITQEQADARYLQRSGGTLSGNIDMDYHQINHVSSINVNQPFFINSEKGAIGINAGPATTLTLNGPDGVVIQGTELMTPSINLSNRKIVALATPTADTDAANKAYVDSKASNWVKAATHSQYDEWHLAVKGGTFVKLVANKDINLEYDVYSSVGQRDAITTLNAPNLYPLSRDKGVYFVIHILMNNYAIIVLESDIGTMGPGISYFKITAHNFTITAGGEAETMFESLQSGQILSEYFVPT